MNLKNSLCFLISVEDILISLFLIIVQAGSSLKFCLVAEGAADIYPRFGPTSEWDIGAAHCVLNEAGGAILDCDGNRLEYNKREMRNPWFLAVGDPTYNWIDLCPRSSV